MTRLRCCRCQLIPPPPCLFDGVDANIRAQLGIRASGLVHAGLHLSFAAVTVSSSGRASGVIENNSVFAVMANSGNEGGNRKVKDKVEGIDSDEISELQVQRPHIKGDNGSGAASVRSAPEEIQSKSPLIAGGLAGITPMK